MAAAGVVDIAEGADMLAESQDVEVQSEMVGFLSETELETMDIAAIAGQSAVVGDIATLRDMPVLAVFLETKGNALHQLAVETIIKFAAGRAVAASLAQTASHVGELGVGEIAEGMVREGVAAKAAVVSEAMAVSGVEKVITGAVEIEAGQELREVGQALALQGVADIAEGAEMIGQAEALDATAGALSERAE